MLVKFVCNREAKNLNELKMKINIAKNFEYSYIRIRFSDEFKLEEISDDVIINMLDNIKNKLLKIDEEYWKSFIIIRRISDNQILKSIITYENKK